MEDEHEPLLSRESEGNGNCLVEFEGDVEPVRSLGEFNREFVVESKKLWYLAGPAIFTSICQYSLGAITQAFAGHVGTLELAAVSMENSVIAGFSLGLLLGMGSALETLCGQAYGAGQLDMLGIYMQRSWVILLTTALILSIFYVFATPFLILIGQDHSIAHATGLFSLYMIPQLFAYAVYFPIQKFLQAQSKMMSMAVIASIALLLHIFFSWLVMIKLNWGMVGAAVVLNGSWWFIVVAQLVYIFSGSCGRAWSGFSWKAFQNLWGFFRLSLASAVMLCLDMWYFMVLILFAGYLKNPEVSVDGLSICMNILGWTMMVAFGFNAATSVRVSNELGAGHPRAAKFSVVVVVTTSFMLGFVLSMILLAKKNDWPKAFTSSATVKKLVSELNPLLCISIIANNIQPVLSGVATGAGWQALVAYVNIGCYYIFGVPLGLLLGYKLDFGVKGIWSGMLAGTVVQTLVLIWMTYRTNWNKEASIAGDRIKHWGGEVAEASDA
ncbi:protein DETOXIFICATION 29 isoform X1 [Amborella trichopoda]|nr:protein DETOXIFICATION 29 isoform X1 [Amborella trichopoda]|eukprot:XP_006852295.2 protein DETOXIFICATION 29 isoform X1 [Amborella trichopoda]